MIRGFSVNRNDGINEADFDPEEDIRLVERLLYDNLSPRPSKEFNSENSNAIIDSFSPPPIPGISLFLKRIASMINSPSLPENESSTTFEHLHDPLSPRPPPNHAINKIFDPGIFIEVQSKRLLSRDEFSISFIRDPLSPVFDTLLPFSSENKKKCSNLGISPHHWNVPYLPFYPSDQLKYGDYEISLKTRE
ncbi:hypothetical protein Tco_0860754 [Tanacetum coccineum]|uniref:Uncharacterized protein n=1 Tax=Tanacetum coccineum TaxID=301880 RepID=A0ABQ5BI32_9ASTR